ncbi:hypothetical protein [Bradyrhizobium archetypum]|uniref:Uncharacterized protein n=1 Tax=Bradyrhizobium archetypum TaxID=2721160 RepID=A0A7Y4M5F5_9BRAD|nr:hypothetical protein [Bradyrhizobium archetypum]NOJ50040.1 hypothetical protein [Bradyrhizobium archetypum]
MSGMAAFMVAVGGTSLICYFLMTRVQSRKARREGASNGASSGFGANNSSGTDSWNLFSWGGESPSSQDSASSSDGGGDSGGGGGGSGD